MASLNKLYTREISEFMESAKQKLVTAKDPKGKLGTNQIRATFSRRSFIDYVFIQAKLTIEYELRASFFYRWHQ